jgi:hypothetical protein
MNNEAPFNAGQVPHNRVAETFLSCLRQARHETKPFDYWLLENVLPAEDIDAITALPFPQPEGIVFSGKRETNNALRLFFTLENQDRFAVCRQVATGFKDPRVKKAIEETTGTDLSDCHLRIEYCQDPRGFWLEPHTDIFVKKFTMLVYLLDAPHLKLAGTDVHEGPPDFRYVTTAPYGRNLGLLFIPGKHTWHGLGHHPIQGLRKSIIINYITSEWRDTWELA